MLTKRELLAYLDRVEPALPRLSCFELLDITPDADEETIRTAYQTSAVRLHPDLYRQVLTARDHERLTSVYARISEAYYILRHPGRRAAYLLRLSELKARRRGTTLPPSRVPTTPPGAARRQRPSSTLPPEVREPARDMASRKRATTIPPNQQDAVSLLTPKAQRLYRRALAAMRTGDTASAILNLRMAVRSSPNSALLKRALADALAQQAGR